MVKTIVEEIQAVSLLSTDLTLVWQGAQTPHTRAASFQQVLGSMGSLDATFASITVPTGLLVAGPTTAAFNALSSSASTTTTNLTSAELELTSLESRVSVLESGGTKTGITVTGIADQDKGNSFGVGGSLLSYSSTPTLEYRDSAGAFADLPGGATVTKTAYSFTHPAVATATAGMTVTVRDKAATTVSATSNSFAIIDTAAGTPLAPTLGYLSNSGGGITVSITPSATGPSLDAGYFQIQYKKTSAGTWTDGPRISYCTPGTGSIIDALSNVWQVTSGGQISQTNAGGTVIDPQSAFVVDLMLIATTMWQDATNPAGPGWYWEPYNLPFPSGAWSGPVATAPLLSPGVVVPTAGGLSLSTSYDLRAATANTAGLGAYSAVLTQTTNATNTFTTGSPVIRSPDRQTFRARGVGVRWLAPDGTTQQGAEWASNMASGEPLTRAFPGLNVVRITAFSAASQVARADVASLHPFIDTLTANDIVVILGCGAGTLTGSDLSAAAAWYADFAAYYVPNAYVWFETPSNATIGAAGNNAMLTAVYGAVRGAGSETMVLISSDIDSSAQVSGYSVNTLAGLHAIGWSQRFYAAQSNYSTDQHDTDTALAALMSRLWTLADIPIVIGEFGDSSDGSTIDAGWPQVQSSVLRSAGSGYVGAWWNTAADSAAYAGNRLLITPFDGNYLSDAGRILANAIKSGQ